MQLLFGMSDDVPFTPKELRENLNVSTTHPLLEFAKLLFGLAISFGAFFICLGLVTDFLVERHHDGLSSLFRSSPQLFASSMDLSLEDTSSVNFQRVKSVFDKLISSSDLESAGHQIHYASSSKMNAYAFPGGHIVVLKGLLDKVSSDQELAFVISHEIAHQENKDSLRSVGRGLALLAFSAFLSGADSTSSNLFADFSNLASSRYSQAQEQAADELGLEILNRAYSEVGGAIRFLERVEKTESGLERFVINKSHPLTQRRLENVKSLILQKDYRVSSR
jgi:Zn-dependent protease with chaperone function